MKIILFITVILSVFSFENKTVYQREDVVAKSYIVMDSSSKFIIEGKNIHMQRSVASISKIMTAIVAIENESLEKEIEVPVEIEKMYGSSVYLKVGEIVTLKDLLYGLMLRSGNDAAMAIAIGVSGNFESFIKLMNDKALSIGMNDTVFSNPSGLDVGETGNLSTSYDMSLLMSYAISNETFLKITSSYSYLSESHGYWRNKNKLLKMYSSTIAGKTGFTGKARRTLVTAAKEGDTTLVIVTLDCGNDFNVHKKLYEYNFKKFETIRFFKKGENNLYDYRIFCDFDKSITIEKKEIDQVKIIYEIKKEIVSIYKVKDGERVFLSNCGVLENNKNEVDKSFFKSIIDFFFRGKKYE